MLTAAQTASQFQVMRATTAELMEAIYRLRYRVYVAEHGRMVHKANHLLREYRDQDDDTAVHLIAESEGEVVACVRIHLRGIPERLAPPLELERFTNFPSNQMALVSKAMVDPRFRQSTVFGRLCSGLHLEGQRADVELAFCTTFPQLVPLYERLGFRAYRTPYLDPDLGPHIALVLFVRDREHLKRVRSPLSRTDSELRMRVNA